MLLFSNDNITAITVNNNTATLLVGGNTPGMVTITGNYTQASTGTLEVDINAAAVPVAGTNNSQLVVNGTASLAGNLLLDTAQGHYEIGSVYNVIHTTGGITGGLNALLSGAYGNYLTVTSAVSDNKDDYLVTVTGFNSPASSAPSTPTLAFTSGRFYGSSLYAQNQALFATLSSVYGTDAGYWMHGLGSFGHAPGVDYNYKGFVAGRGFAVNQHLIVGGALANVYSNTSDNNESSVKGSNVGGLVYGIYSLPRWTLTGQATVGHLGNSATRNLPGIGQGKFATNGVYSGVALRADYALLERQHLFITPYAGVSYLYTTTGSGQETGLNKAFDMNLRYGRTNSSLAQASGGFTAGYKTSVAYGTLVPWASLGGTGTLGNTHTRVVETLGSQTANISAQIASTGAFTPAAGILLVGQSSPWQLSTSWHGQFAKRANAQAFTLNGSYRF